MSYITISEVVTKDDLWNFIRFPKTLYKRCPHYVPSLESEDYATLTSHPAKEFCSIRMWLAYKNGKMVGRIAGIINHKCNEIKKQKRIRFGWFDVINDWEVATSLMETVENWGKREQLLEISGPSRFSNMEKQAMLIEGFDKTPPISAEYNYDYYPELVKKMGFEKEVDYVQYKVKVKEVPEHIKRLNAILAEKYHIKIKYFKNKQALKAIGKYFFETINESYRDIYNFIPLNEDEINWVVKSNFKVADQDLVCLLEDENGKIIGISFCLPSLSKAFQKANGKLFPFGWISVLKALKKNRLVDMYITGVLPEWSKKGIHSIYHCKLNEVFLEKGYQYAITSQQLENNIASRIWEKYDSEIIFRRRCFIKKLSLVY